MRYTGRIWVEDQEYNIVRTKGSHDGSTFSHQFHSDGWRQNCGPACGCRRMSTAKSQT